MYSYLVTFKISFVFFDLLTLAMLFYSNPLNNVLKSGIFIKPVSFSIVETMHDKTFHTSFSTKVTSLLPKISSVHIIAGEGIKFQICNF